MKDNHLHSLSKDRLFDPSKLPLTSSARRLTQDAIHRVSLFESRQRRRKADDQVRFESAVTAIVCDLAHHALIRPGDWLAVEMTKKHLAPGTRRAPFMTEQFPDVVRLMGAPETALLELRLGTHSPFGGRRSTMRAGERLLQLLDGLDLTLADFGRDLDLLGDPIVLRSTKVGGSARKLPLPDTDDVNSLRSEMRAVNDWLACAEIDWWGAPEDDGVDPGDRFLRRIFNNGSFEHGGRLFGGFWQGLSSEERLNGIRIEGVPVASVDFGQMGVRLAYALAGASPADGDLYAIPGIKGQREGVKKVMGALLAADQMPRRMPAGTRRYFPATTKIHNVVAAMARHHAPIRHLFGTGLAFPIMYQESRVLLAVLKRLRGTGVVALPIHDCVLVRSDRALETKSIMEEVFLSITGVRGEATIQLPPSPSVSPSGGHQGDAWLS